MKMKSQNKSVLNTIPSKKSKTIFENSWYFDVIGLGIVILLGVLIYSNSFDCSFHFDDEGNIINNANRWNSGGINTWWNFDSRQVAMFTFALNYHFHKLNVFGYHLVNLIIHLINAILVGWITLKIFSSPVMKNNPISKHKKYIALLTALLFVSHPLATQSVTYIVQRMASLGAMFFFISLGLYLTGRLSIYSKFTKYCLFAGSIVSFIFAIHTKENTYTLPIIIFIVEVLFFRIEKLNFKFNPSRKVIFLAVIVAFVFVIIAIYSPMLFASLPPSEPNNYMGVTPINYLLTQFSVIVKYIQLLIIPVSQNLDYDYPLITNFLEIKTILCFLLLLTLIGFAFYSFNKNRIVSFGIFWFLITLSIESSLIVLNDPIYEHRT